MAQPIRFALLALILGLPLAQPRAAFAGAMVAQASPNAEQATPAPATPNPANSDAPTAPGPSTGGAAWRAVLGNTISGRTPDGPYTEFFKPDGTAIHLDRDGKDVGRWALKEPSICFTYPDDDEEDCRKLQVEGTHGTFVDQDGSSYRFEVLPGNPKNL